MKKVLAVAAAAGILAAASFASAATIVGSKHDLTSSQIGGTIKGNASNNSQICIYCHAPHGAIQSIPLWNRTNPDPTTFILYSGVNMASTSFKTGFTADSTSLFCMSCHDGGTNMNAVHNEGSLVRNVGLNQAGTAGLPFYDGVIGGTLGHSGNFGSDLSTTHPINFPVAAADTQSDLWVAGATTTMGGGATTLVTTFPLFKTAADAGMPAARGTDRSLECGSCHAVHDSLNSPFLRFTMEGSKLCLGCHNK
jgi:predicted CXXCH cytochrome family protein